VPTISAAVGTAEQPPNINSSATAAFAHPTRLRLYQVPDSQMQTQGEQRQCENADERRGAGPLPQPLADEQAETGRP
jgi:hypothetical protein